MLPDPSLLVNLRELVSGFAELELAVAFGSQARGRAHSGSDIDLAVRLASETPEANRRLLRRRLQVALSVPLDLVFMDEAPALLRLEIARHGQPLLERRAGGWSTFKAQAMIDWGDFADTARLQWSRSIQRLRKEVAGGST